MNITASVFLDSRRLTKKGYPIKIRISQNRTAKFISLHWYSSTKKIKDPILLDRINQKNIEILPLVNHCNDLKFNLDQAIEFIKESKSGNALEKVILETKLKEINKEFESVHLLDFFDTRIKEKKAVGESTQDYVNVQNVIKKYLFPATDINMNKVTYEWLQNFITVKLATGCTRGGVNAYLRTIRAVYKEAQKRESLGVKQDNPFLGLMKKSAKKSIIQLDKIEIKAILDYTCTKKFHRNTILARNRNISLWKLQFYIGGHDLADIALLKWSDIKNDRINFFRFKNRNKPGVAIQVSNPLNKIAKNIIDKFGTKEDERIFSFIPHPLNDKDKYSNWRSNLNRSLKSISEELELSNKITSKSTRYLFRSLAGQLFISDIVVMQIQGHTPTGITFSYQGRVPNNILDGEIKKVIDSIE